MITSIETNILHKPSKTNELLSSVNSEYIAKFIGNIVCMIFILNILISMHNGTYWAPVYSFVMQKVILVWRTSQMSD